MNIDTKFPLPGPSFRLVFPDIFDSRASIQQESTILPFSELNKSLNDPKAKEPNFNDDDTLSQAVFPRQVKTFVQELSSKVEIQISKSFEEFQQASNQHQEFGKRLLHCN